MSARASWYDEARVRQPGSVVLRAWNAQRAAARAAANAPHVSPRLRPIARSFSGGDTGGYAGSWGTTDAHVNQSLLRGLRTLRARANDLARNNDHAVQFLRMVGSHVIGPAGIALQAQPRNARGALIDRDATRIETAWAEWGKREACTTTGELSWLELQRLWIHTIARDGEVLVQRVRGAGPFGYQLRLREAALLDEHHNETRANGHRIRMGVEFDAADRRVAYWLSTRDRSDPRTLAIVSTVQRVRVPATDIWHDFVPLWIDQCRGIPWMAPTMIRQKRLNEFETAAVAAAEEGAKKVAWITSRDGDPTPLANQVGGEGSATTAEPVPGDLQMTSGASVEYAFLPDGYALADWDPKYPNADFGAFTRAALRSIASGLGVPYHHLAQDLEGVNYSSARAGELEVRQYWIALQNWAIERLHARVYAEWLPLAILSGGLALDPARVDRYRAVRWQGRRWPWVDPLKDIQAAKTAIELGVTSRQRVMREQGVDPDEIWAELEQERERGFVAAPTHATAQPPASTETDDGRDPAGAEDTEADTDA